MAEQDILEGIKEMLLETFKKENSVKSKFISIESLIKLGFGSIMCVLSYAGMSYKIDNTAANIIEIRMEQKDSKKDNDLQRETMKIQIQACQTELAVLKGEIDNLKTYNNDNKYSK